MDDHLRERHPNWQLTVSKEKRYSFLAQILVTETEEHRLGITQTAPAVDGTVSDSVPNSPRDEMRGQKRLPQSPAGTPRRPRRLRMSHTSALPPQTSHNTAEHDVFLA
jgi:hypothetical protein